jgi:uncharacterized protein YdaU (DUF1376 family)
MWRAADLSAGRDSSAVADSLGIVARRERLPAVEGGALMASLPYFRFFPSDWLGSGNVTLMSDAERGIYIMLLAVAWGRPGCLLPLDPEVCRKLIRSKRTAPVAKVLEMCFVRTEFGHSNNKLQTEFEHASGTQQGAKKAANSRWNKGKQDANAMRTDMRTQCQPDSKAIPEEPIPSLSPKAYPDWFETFWGLYPARNGKKAGKKTTHKLALSLSQADRDLLLVAVRNYAASEDCRRGFSKDPERFLKNDYWRDFIDAPTTPCQPGPPAGGPVRSREGFA